MENKLLFIGALGAFFLATTVTLVSDMRGLGDWYISSLASAKVCFESSAHLRNAIHHRWLFRRTAVDHLHRHAHRRSLWKLAQISSVHCADRHAHRYPVYLGKSVLELRHINFADSIQIHSTINDYTVLTQAGFLKGLGALFGGLIGGFGFSTALTILFFSLRNPYGIAGGLIVIATMLIGMPAKIYFMNHVSSTVLNIFIISMVIKNFGIAFMGVGLLTESLK